MIHYLNIVCKSERQDHTSEIIDW